MRKYLRAQEYQEISLLINLPAYIEEEFIPKWKKQHMLSEEEEALLKSGMLSIYKAFELIDKRLNPEFAETLIKKLKQLEIITLPKREARELEMKLREDAKFMAVSRESMNTITYRALFWCNPCAQDPTTCDLKKCLMDAQIEPFNFEDVECPYRIKKKRVMKKKSVEGSI